MLISGCKSTMTAKGYQSLFMGIYGEEVVSNSRFQESVIRKWEQDLKKRYSP